MFKYDDILNDFKTVGIEKGDTVFIQSALRPAGNIEGGAPTIVKALLETVGKDGTVVAPAFCFAHEKDECPIIDNDNDPSEMGIISETIRRHPGAKRSIAYRHSVCAVGKYAEEITDVDPSLSVFDIRSSFGKMLGYDTKVLLFGVTYLNSTSHHFAEYLLQVPDRMTVNVPAKLKMPDGTLRDIITCDYRPKPNDSGEYYSYPHDFDRSGLELEKAGKVCISHVGNAVTRVYGMRDLIHYFIDNYSVEYNLFAEDKNGKTKLPDGEEVSMTYFDGAGREDLAVWSCVDASKIFKRGGVLTPVTLPSKNISGQ